MSAMKHHMMVTNHPSTWVKGDGAGLPRTFTLSLGDKIISFTPQGENVYITTYNYKGYLSKETARIIYNKHIKLGYQRLR